MFLKAVNQVRNNSFSLAKQCWFGVEFWCKATGEVGCEVPLKCSLSYIVSPWEILSGFYPRLIDADMKGLTL